MNKGLVTSIVGGLAVLAGILVIPLAGSVPAARAASQDPAVKFCQPSSAAHPEITGCAFLTDGTWTVPAGVSLIEVTLVGEDGENGRFGLQGGVSFFGTCGTYLGDRLEAAVRAPGSRGTSL